MSHRRHVTGPYFPFYAQDFLLGTIGMSVAAQGVYVRLLCLQWDAGFVPVDTGIAATLLAIARDEFERLWPEVLPKFRLLKRGYSNARLEEERAKLRGIVEKRRIAGRRSGEVRAKPKSPTPAAERATPKALAPVSANPHHQPTNLINGASNRRHGTHAWCSSSAGRDGLCVPYFLHEEFIGKSARSEPDVKAWYLATIGALNGHAIGEDALVFWRNSFAQWIGIATVMPTGDTKAGRALAGAKRIIAESKLVRL